MKNALSLIGIITITAIIGFAFTACTEEKPDIGTKTSTTLTGTVTITGTAQVGETLTANTSALGGTGTISYQWKRGGTPIGENKNTYDVQTSDVGSTITVTVTRAGYSGSVVSGATAEVIAALPVLGGTVSISTSAVEGQVLTADTDNLEGEGFIYYQWKRGDDNVGLLTRTYTVQADDIDSIITVTVTRSDRSGSVTSNQCVVKQGTEGLAYTPIKGNSEYSVSIGTARAIGEIVIPAKYDGLFVTMIANDAFSGCSNMTGIVIPNSITSIGSYAFRDCSSLTRVVLPDSLEIIGEGAFYNTNLVRVTFTAAVIQTVNFSTTSPFPGDLRSVYFSDYGGKGTYTRPNTATNTWTGSPTGVKVTGATTDGVSISWNSMTVSGAYGYTIYRGSSENGIFTEVGVKEPSIWDEGETSFYDTGLTEGTTYFYRVALMYNNGDMSPQSKNTVSTTTIPGIPTDVSAVLTSSTSVTVSWSHAEGATGYRIYRSTNTNGTFTEVGTSTTTSYTNSGLTGGTDYFFKVAAYNSNGTGKQSDAVGVSAVATPTEVTATATSSSSITVSWSAVTGATGYRIYRSTSASSNFSEVGTSTTANYTDSGITASTTYYYRVVAFNTHGSGTQSGNAVVPGMPSNVTATAASSNSINVSWSSVTGATGYRIYRSSSSTGTFTEAGTSATTSFSNSGLTVNTTYFYRVAAYIGSVTGMQSSSVNATTAPDMPTGVSAVAASSSSINISWNSVIGATGYRIYRSTSTSTFTEVGTSETTSYSDTGLNASITYYYRVAAYNSNGTGVQSNTVNAKILPDTPTGVTATAESSSSITVRWSSVTGTTGYRVYRSTSSTGTFSEVGISTTTSYTDNGLTGYTTYYYRVAAYNVHGTGSQSSTVNTTTVLDTPVGVTAKAATTNSIYISWNSVSGATGYRIYRSMSSTGTFESIGTSITTSYTNLNLTKDTTYFYKVAAYNNNGTGTQSDVVNAITIVFHKISTGSTHTVAIKTNGTLWAWGNNTNDQLGDSVTTTYSRTPVQIGTANDWVSISAGTSHTVAIKTNGTLWAWGNNYNGELGDGTNENKRNPVQVGTANDWASVSAGSSHTVAIKTDGTLWAWGNNLYGGLGDGTTTNRSAPVQIGTKNDWKLVSAALWYTVAIKTDGTLWTWGVNNFGQLGNGTIGSGFLDYSKNTNTPIQVGIENTWELITACFGSQHTIAFKKDGTVWVWGRGHWGMLGDGTEESKSSPVKIGDANIWSFTTGGSARSFAIKIDGTLWAWGSNDYGGLGDGTTTNRLSPVRIGTESNWEFISVGGEHTVAFKKDGTLWAWGRNNYGQFGDGTTTDSYSPIQIYIP